MGINPSEPSRLSWGQRLQVLLRRMLLHNALLKAISLTLAFVIWYSVASLQPRDVTLFNVPLNVVNNRPDTSVESVAYKVVDLRVRGRLKQLSAVSPLSVPVLVDVSSLDPGVHSVWIDPGKIPLPAGVEVLRADPVSVPVTIERVISKSVPVDIINDSSALPADRMLVGVEISPKEIDVTGPQSLLAPIQVYRAGTVRWEVRDDQSSATRVLPVTLESLKVTPSEVSVSARFDRVEEMTIRNVPLRLPSPVNWVSSPMVAVTIAGASSWLQRLSRDQVVVTLDVTSLPPGVHSVAPRMQVPNDWHPYIRSIRFDPVRVSVRSK